MKKTTCYKKIAAFLSLCALIVWGVCGTGTSLAWFSDTTETLNNIFHFADFEVQVSQRTENGNWVAVNDQTPVFNNQALYEPGYVQVIYLRVQNTGERPFLFKTAVNVNGCTRATNAFGQSFALQDYLRFGVVTADSEQKMDDRVVDRDAANSIANTKLHTYSTEKKTLHPGEFAFVSVVVRMPEEVNNVANYRGETVPKVDLGIIIKAEQVVG